MNVTFGKLLHPCHTVVTCKCNLQSVISCIRLLGVRRNKRRCAQRKHSQSFCLEVHAAQKVVISVKNISWFFFLQVHEGLVILHQNLLENEILFLSVGIHVAVQPGNQMHVETRQT